MTGLGFIGPSIVRLRSKWYKDVSRDGPANCTYQGWLIKLVRSNEQIDAEERLKDARTKENLYLDRGKDPGGFKRDREIAEKRLRDAGGDPSRVRGR